MPTFPKKSSCGCAGKPMGYADGGKVKPSGVDEDLGVGERLRTASEGVKNWAGSAVDTVTKRTSLKDAELRARKGDTQMREAVEGKRRGPPQP